jgi:hypothetical protein
MKENVAFAGIHNPKRLPVPLHAMEALGGWERKYSSYSFLTLALDWGEESASCLSRSSAPRKGCPVPVGQEARWAPVPVQTERREEKSSCLCRGSNPDLLDIQVIVRHYTEWATPAPSLNTWCSINNSLHLQECITVVMWDCVMQNIQRHWTFSLYMLHRCPSHHTGHKIPSL